MEYQIIFVLLLLALILLITFFLRQRNQLISLEKQKEELNQQLNTTLGDLAFFQKQLEEIRDQRWNILEVRDQAVHAEQERIAEELHDDTIQQLITIRLRLEEQLMFAISPNLKHNIQQLRDDLEGVMRDLRFLINGIPLAQFTAQSFRL